MRGELTWGLDAWLRSLTRAARADSGARECGSREGEGASVRLTVGAERLSGDGVAISVSVVLV